MKVKVVKKILEANERIAEANRQIDALMDVVA